MRIKVKINPKTGVVYLPKSIVEDGFTGQVDVYGAGSVIVISRPDADAATIKESMSLVAKDIEITGRGRSQRTNRLPRQKE